MTGTVIDEKRRINFFKSIKDIFFCKCSKEKQTEADRLYRKRVLILIVCHVVALVQSCGYFIQHTAFPYLTKSLDVTPQMYGYIMSVNAAVQLIGGPVCGRLADIYGARFSLVLSYSALAVSYIIIAISTNIPLLFLSKIPTFFAHALQSKYMVISEVTFQEDRADQLGKLGVSHGLGMVIGSIVGGFVTDIMGQRPAVLVSVVFMVACGLVCFVFIPKDTSTIRKEIEAFDIEQNKECFIEKDDDKISSIGLKEIMEVAKMPHVIYLLSVKIITGFPFGVLSAMFTLLLMDYYKLTPKENGAVLAYLGAVGMITQGVLVGLLTKHFTDEVLLKMSTIIMGVGFLYLIISQSIFLFCVASIPLTVGGSLIHIIITAIITKVVRNDQTGSALGLTLCMHASYRTIAPTVGGFLLERIGFFSFGVLGYVTNLFVTIYLCFYGRTDFS